MIAGNIILILELAARRDRDQHIVAVARRRDPQAMRVEVGIIETALFLELLFAALLELIVEIDGQSLPRRDSYGRRDEIPIVLATAAERAQIDLIVGLRPRIVDRALGPRDFELVVDIVHGCAAE